MDRKQAIEKLERINKIFGSDEEVAHAMADEVLCEFLTSLGYKGVVKAWDKIAKLYA